MKRPKETQEYQPMDSTCSRLPRRLEAAEEVNDHLLLREIVEEILRHLPVKSLIRFRCVSTSWKSLISDGYFMRKHAATGNAAHPNYLFEKTLVDHESLDSLPLSCLQTLGKRYVFGEVPARTAHLAASCDGLLCVRADQILYIWNPSTKTHREIPSSKAEIRTQTNWFDNQTVFVGSVEFGYDSRRKDYKLLKLLRPQWHGKAIETEIYSLKTGLWTKADDFPKESFPCYDSVSTSGAIHWLHVRHGSPIEFVSFYLSENKYIEVPMPEFRSRRCYPYKVRVSVLGGRLCVLINGSEGLVLWANKDYRNPKSWTKILEIPFGVVFYELYTLSNFKPLYVYENDEVLLGAFSGGVCGKTELQICKNNQVMCRRITRHPTSVIDRNGYVHVESLISL